MFGGRTSGRRRPKDDGERPFWISFADLMSALMVLFLVVMAVALVRAQSELSQSERDKIRRQRNRDSLIQRLNSVARENGLVFDEASLTFGLGDLALFKKASDSLEAVQVTGLRQKIPQIVHELQDTLARETISRIYIEGYASREGSADSTFGYLGNLDLSLRRAERLLCELLDPSKQPMINEQDRQFIRRVFFVGGFSFNQARLTEKESRRIALKVELRESGDSLPEPIDSTVAFGQCRIDDRGKGAR